MNAEGQPIRVILSGFPQIPGKTMMEKKRYFQENFDHLRKNLTREPSGHDSLVTTVVTSPSTDKADFGVLYLHPEGYFDMCIDGTLGTVGALIKTGIVEPKEPVTNLTLDTPSGIINVRVEVKNGTIGYITVQNVPSFLYKKDVPINVLGRSIPVDIAFGGNFYALVEAEELNVKVAIENLEKLKSLGISILHAVNQQVKVQHPRLPEINRVGLVQIYDKPVNPKATHRNILVYGNYQVGRSPCGTGTSAKLASLYARGKLKLNQEIINESLIGTLFKGKIVAETSEGYIPEISGRAWINGFGQFLIEEDDPLKEGFIL